MRGLDLKDVLEIPPPITEENKDRYLEELSKITEADDWIERHSIDNKSNQDVNKTGQHRDAKTTFEEEPAKFYEVIIEAVVGLVGVIILFFGVPLLGFVLFY
ncbi:MAG: hypothetical protein VXV81_04280 [Candidatus Thermoplasmatota archaeon]|nr:hypothetical protein [Candidatus Thermoplasmatota archaeon]